MSQADAVATRTFLRGISTAVPENRYTKAECLAEFESSEWFSRLERRSHVIARTVLQRDNGIDARRLAVGKLAEVFDIDPDTLSQRFVLHAPALGSEAAAGALQGAGLAAADIDAVIVSTCTGYLCPGLSGYIVERLGLRSDVQAMTSSGRAARPHCQTCNSVGRCSAGAIVKTSCRSVSKSAVPRCTSMTIQAS